MIHSVKKYFFIDFITTTFTGNVEGIGDTPFELVTTLVSLTGDSSVLVHEYQIFLDAKYFTVYLACALMYIYYNSVHSHRTPQF